MWLALWQRIDTNVQNWVLNVPVNWGWMQKDTNTESDLLTFHYCPPQLSNQKTDEIPLITISWLYTLIYCLFCFSIALKSQVPLTLTSARHTPQLHDRWNIQYIQHARMIKSSTRDNVWKRQGYSLYLQRPTVNRPSGTTVRRRCCDLDSSHLIFGTQFTICLLIPAILCHSNNHFQLGSYLKP